MKKVCRQTRKEPARRLHNLHFTCTACTLIAHRLHALHFLYRKRAVQVVLRRTNSYGR